MFENVKLEKGMYNLSGKSFEKALEEMDPNENYEDTPYENMDAFERQLKRFDIKISGKNCDRIEKFFESTESAVLFPEFCRRAVRAGMDGTALNSIVAAGSFCIGSKYNGIEVDDSESYDEKGTEGSDMPTTDIRECQQVVTLEKYCRNITSSYEAVRQQRCDVMAVILKNVGKKIAGALVKDAVNRLKKNAQSITITGADLTYADIATLFGSFSNYTMDKIIVAPKVAAKILAMDEMKQNTRAADGKIYLPFGSEMIITPNAADTEIVGIDSGFALEFVAGSDVCLESDKLIDRQLDITVVSIMAAFKTIFSDAAMVLKLTK